MANIMMTPLLASPSANQGPEPKSQVSGNENNFSDYMEKKVRSERSEEKALLGVQAKKRQNAEDNTRRLADEPKEQKESDSSSASAEDLLRQLMADLRQLLEGPENGEWSFDFENSGLLEKLAAQAGMDMSKIADLQQQLASGESVGLNELFSLFEQHFSEISQDIKVTAPETDIPLLETLLDKMGISPEDLAKLSAQSVDGMGEFDLQAYLEGLSSIDDASLQGITLTDWELQQLQNMLSAAGVNEDEIDNLFPEHLAPWREALADLRPGEGNDNVKMSLERLQEILQKAAQDVESSQPKANLPGFIKDLEMVLTQSGFDDTVIDWNPVVQKSVSDIFNQLQKMLDLAKIEVEKITENLEVDEGLTKEWLASGAKITEEVVGQSGNLSSDNNPGDQPEFIPGVTLQELDEGNESSFNHLVNGADVQEVDVKASDNTVDQRITLPKFRFAADTSQFTASQITQGVMRGLRNSEHHLIMTMYPKELGEVKVDLHVRDNQLSVSFVMENPKVKDALEANMQEFKENLEKQGYSLEGCAVSVGQEDSDETRQRFQMAWDEMNALHSANNNENSMMMDLSNIESGNGRETLHSGAISLFV